MFCSWSFASGDYGGELADLGTGVLELAEPNRGELKRSNMNVQSIPTLGMYLVSQTFTSQIRL